MIRVLFPLFFLVISVFGSDQFFQNRILFALQRGVPNLKTGIIGKKPASGHPEIDQLLAKHGAVRLEKWLTSADETDVVEGVDLSKIYRVVFASEKSVKEIDHILADFRQVDGIHSSDRETKFYIKQTLEPKVPSDTYFSQQWYMKRIMADFAWALWGDRVPGDSTILVGVVDSGIDYLHPDLKDAMYLNPGEDIDGDGLVTSADSNGVDDDGNGFEDDFYGWDFVGPNINTSKVPDNDIRPPDAGPNEELSHGTHVAGVMAATSDNELGMASIGFQCKIIGTKNSYDDDLTDVTIDGGYDGILYCAKMGADVINCSWGGQGFSFYDRLVMEQVSDYDAIVVCAAGNGGSDGVGDDNAGNPHFPSDLESTIAVAALNSRENKASFSNYGEVIDISAPGVGIFSTIHWGQGDYATWNGTSMASPVVAGSFALLKAFFPDSSREWLIETLLSTADPIDEQNPSYIGKLGTGRVNVYNALAVNLMPKIDLVDYNYTILNDDGNGLLNPGERISINLTLKNDEKWSDANMVKAVISSTDSNLVVVDSIAGFSDMLPGDSAVVLDGQLSVDLLTEATYKSYIIEVIITSNDTSDFPYQSITEIPVEPSLTMAGFPKEAPGLTAPLGVANVSGDSLREIIAVGANDSLYVVEANGDAAQGFPVSIESYTTMAPIVADVDSDGYKEIIIINQAGVVFVFEHDGSLMFRQDLDETFRGDAALGNLDDDPQLELVFGTYKNTLHVLNLDSTEVPGFPVEFTERIRYGVALADLDGDQNPEIITGNENSEITAITVTGDTLAGFPLALSDDLNAAPIVIQYGEHFFIVAIQQDQHVTVLREDGQISAGYDVGADVDFPAAFADVNSDDVPEIIFSDSDGRVHAIDFEGNTIAPFPFMLTHTAQTSPVIHNFDEDPEPEIVFGGGSGFLEIVNSDGSSFVNFPAELGGSLTSTPVIADLDRDKDLEIIAGGGSGLQVLDMAAPGIPGAVYWQTYLGNNHRTGYYQDILTAIPAWKKRPELPDRYTMSQNYPNPFNPATNIIFSIPQNQTGKKVQIDIYNILGAKIKTLLNADMNAGRHSVTWNGTDDSERKVSSGFYIVRLRGGNHTIVRKMLLLK